MKSKISFFPSLALSFYVFSSIALGLNQEIGGADGDLMHTIPLTPVDVINAVTAGPSAKQGGPARVSAGPEGPTHVKQLKEALRAVSSPCSTSATPTNPTSGVLGNSAVSSFGLQPEKRTEVNPSVVSVPPIDGTTFPVSRGVQSTPTARTASAFAAAYASPSPFDSVGNTDSGAGAADVFFGWPNVPAHHSDGSAIRSTGGSAEGYPSLITDPFYTGSSSSRPISSGPPLSACAVGSASKHTSPPIPAAIPLRRSGASFRGASSVVSHQLKIRSASSPGKGPGPAGADVTALDSLPGSELAPLTPKQAETMAKILSYRAAPTVQPPASSSPRTSTSSVSSQPSIPSGSTSVVIPAPKENVVVPAGTGSSAKKSVALHPPSTPSPSRPFRGGLALPNSYLGASTLPSSAAFGRPNVSVPAGSILAGPVSSRTAIPAPAPVPIPVPVPAGVTASTTLTTSTSYPPLQPYAVASALSETPPAPTASIVLPSPAPASALAAPVALPAHPTDLGSQPSPKENPEEIPAWLLEHAKNNNQKRKKGYVWREGPPPLSAQEDSTTRETYKQQRATRETHISIRLSMESIGTSPDPYDSLKFGPPPAGKPSETPPAGASRLGRSASMRGGATPTISRVPSAQVRQQPGTPSKPRSIGPSRTSTKSSSSSPAASTARVSSSAPPPAHPVGIRRDGPRTSQDPSELHSAVLTQKTAEVLFDSVPFYRYE